MKTKFIYESPVVEVLEIAAEGVLCGSFGQEGGKATNEKWSYSNTDIWGGSQQ